MKPNTSNNEFYTDKKVYDIFPKTVENIELKSFKKGFERGCLLTLQDEYAFLDKYHILNKDFANRKHKVMIKIAKLESK
jgi:hypothetical protein